MYKYVYLTLSLLRIAELCEQIEVLDMAIQFREDSNKPHVSAGGDASAPFPSPSTVSLSSQLVEKLPQLTQREGKVLLAAYIGKVIDIRMACERDKALISQLETKLADRDRAVEELERLLRHAQADRELRMMKQEKVHICGVLSV